MTDPTAISSLRAGSRTTILRVRTPPGARRPPGSRSLMRGREPPKIPPPSGLARTVAPDPVIGMCWPKSGRRNRGRNDGAFGRRSLTPLAIPNAIFLLRPREWVGEREHARQPRASEVRRVGCLRREVRLHHVAFGHADQTHGLPHGRGGSGARDLGGEEPGEGIHHVLVQGGHSRNAARRVPEVVGEVWAGLRVRGARGRGPAHHYPQARERREMVDVL